MRFAIIGVNLKSAYITEDLVDLRRQALKLADQGHECTIQADGLKVGYIGPDATQRTGVGYFLDENRCIDYHFMAREAIHNYVRDSRGHSRPTVLLCTPLTFGILSQQCRVGPGDFEINGAKVRRCLDMEDFKIECYG